MPRPRRLEGKEGTMAVRSRYKLKLVRGALYVDRLHVQGVIDHDAREIRVSDEVEVTERLELAAKLKRLAQRQASRMGPFTRVYRHGAFGGRGRALARS
jgi:hypothetical protein